MKLIQCQACRGCGWQRPDTATTTATSFVVYSYDWPNLKRCPACSGRGVVVSVTDPHELRAMVRAGVKL